CTNLSATYHQTGLTDSYVVASVPYAPPFPYTGGTVIPITSDDDWSGVINIPFDFCFYGGMYNQLIIGDNGCISFDVTDASGYCPWSYTNGIPYDYGSPMHIFGAYHDTYLPAGGGMSYSLEGTYPCRMFVFKFNNVAQYSCNSIATTQQIVLYETTNCVEVYVDYKPVCTGWNGGLGVIGIQNISQTVAVPAPGRNAVQWTANDEAWRFTPSGAPNYTINWYEGATLIGTGQTVNVCPTTTTTYTAEAVYQHCNGTSTVIVTDDVTVNVISTLQVDAGTSQSICPGGSVDLGGNPTAGNGAAPYTYSWSPATGLSSTSVSNPTATPTTTTTYTVTITDSGGCVVTDDVTITVSSPTMDSYTTTPDDCGLNNGTLTITATGGYGAPYTYNIGSGAQASNNFTNLPAGPYTVTITDSGGCTGTGNMTVATTGAVTSGFTASANQCLSGNSFDFTNTGDTGAGYTFSWTFSGGTPASSTSENPAAITFSTPGPHQVTQTIAMGACNDVTTIDIEVYAHPTTTTTFVNVTCNGMCDGSVTANPVGGTVPYTYLWSDGQLAQTASNLCAGTYNYTVTDANGCTVTGNGTVAQNTAIVINSENSTDVTCYGDADGSVTVTSTGGCPPVTYAITGTSNGNGIFPNLPGGTFTVTITDCNGCTVTSNPLTVIEPASIVINSQSSTNVTCYGLNDGTFTITASGGAGALQYAINGGITQPGGVFVNLAPGNYTSTVTDANGCFVTQGFSITQPQEMIISSTQDHIICNGESTTINVSVVGGTAPYTYNWSHTGPISANSITVSPSSETTYTVYVTDINGCTSNNSTTIIYVSPPVQVSVFANTTEVCPGDQVIINVNPTSGFGPPYEVYYNGNLQNVPFNVYPMTTANYTISVEDICGSTAEDDVTITVHPLPSVSFQLDTTEGCQPFTVSFISIYPAAYYVWNFGDYDNNNLSYDANPTHVFEDPGTYTISLQVTSDFGCKNSKTVADLIRVWELPTAKFIANPEVVSIIKPMVYFTNLSSLADSCFWYFGDGDSSNNYNPYHMYPIYPTGDYNVVLVVCSENGCRDTVFSTVIVKNEYTFYAPSAFSPDNDGLNDYFQVFGNGVDERNFQLYIYDRWGEVIFETRDFNENWDGRVKGQFISAPLGVYTWLVIYKDLQNIEHQETGAVTIIR
ncbi:MAG: PKD domain-containing protein, partial [Bacteroidota bacterium]